MKSIFSDRYTKMLRLLITARKEKPLTQVELAQKLKNLNLSSQNMSLAKDALMLSNLW